MGKVFKYTGIAVIIIFILFSFLYFNSDIGTARSKIEKEARFAHKVDDRWQVIKSTTDTMSAMLFYNSDFDDHTFSIYVNRKGLSFGYFYRGGGSLSVDDNHIAKYHVEGYQEMAYISINKQQVIKIEIDDGNIVETIDIDNTKPFSVIFPNNSGIIKFYDINGDSIEPFSISL